MTRIGGGHFHPSRAETLLLLRRAALLAACALLGPPAVRGGEVPLPRDFSACLPEQRLHWRGGTLGLEDDLFTGADRNYTNGVALTAVSRDLHGALRPECLPRPIGTPASWVGLIPTSGVAPAARQRRKTSSFALARPCTPPRIVHAPI